MGETCGETIGDCSMSVRRASDAFDLKDESTLRALLGQQQITSHQDKPFILI